MTAGSRSSEICLNYRCFNCIASSGDGPYTGTSAGVKSWKGVETTSALQAQSHAEAMEMRCCRHQVFFGLRANTTGEHVVVHLKKAAAAAVLSRRVHAKSKKHLVPAGIASP